MNKLLPFKGILLDAYGVFWGGNDIGPFPEAIETMKTLVTQGKQRFYPFRVNSQAKFFLICFYYDNQLITNNLTEL